MIRCMWDKKLIEKIKRCIENYNDNISKYIWTNNLLSKTKEGKEGWGRKGEEKEGRGTREREREREEEKQGGRSERREKVVAIGGDGGYFYHF